MPAKEKPTTGWPKGKLAQVAARVVHDFHSPYFIGCLSYGGEHKPVRWELQAKYSVEHKRIMRLLLFSYRPAAKFAIGASGAALGRGAAASENGHGVFDNIGLGLFLLAHDLTMPAVRFSVKHE